MDIPDIVFSEVMRDVDLAVSVAHAGGVDPKTAEIISKVILFAEDGKIKAPTILSNIRK